MGVKGLKKTETLMVMESHALIGLGVLVFGLVYAEKDVRENFEEIKHERVKFLQNWLQNPKSNEAILNKFENTTIFNIFSDASGMTYYQVTGTEKLTNKVGSRTSIAVQYGIDADSMRAFLIEKDATKTEVDYKCGKLSGKTNLKQEIEETLASNPTREPKITVGEEFGVLWALIDSVMGWVKISHDTNLDNYYIDIQKESADKQHTDELHYKLTPKTLEEFTETFNSVEGKTNK